MISASQLAQVRLPTIVSIDQIQDAGDVIGYSVGVVHDESFLANWTRVVANPHDDTQHTYQPLNGKFYTTHIPTSQW